jgi:hypothetical protein
VNSSGKDLGGSKAKCRQVLIPLQEQTFNAVNTMKKLTIKILLVLSLVAGTVTGSMNNLSAATPAQEKAFIEAYKKAFESKDEATLKSFLYTKGADPMALEFYTMMATAEMGSKISSITLENLGPDDVKKADETMDGPSGKMKLPLKAVKKLVIKIKQKDSNGSSSSTSESFVAESDGKLVIPVPAPAK